MANFTKKGRISITCPKGFVPYLQDEVRQLGFKPEKIRPTGLEVDGSLNDCIALNFWLRTAHRVHFLVGESSSVKHADALCEWLHSIDWETYISSGGYFSVTSFIDHPAIDNTQFANLKVKDAVVDRIRSVTGHRPDSGSDKNKTVLFLYWDRKTCRIFLDTSGESLSRRGYRIEHVAAPMQESLASVLVQASRWEPGMHLVNPMCGSGTIAIEAALIALNRPPASLRHEFGFMHIDGYDEGVYTELRGEGRKNTKKSFDGKIIATDHDPRAVEAAKKNAKTAGVDHLIDFEVCEFNETTVPEGNGVVILNPPYGERLDEAGNLAPLYKKIGDFLKNKCAGKTGYILTGNFELAKKIGLRSQQRIPLFNSTIECRLLEFEIFKGSR